jgi:hypothetical protein
MAGFVSLDGLFAGRHFDREIIILCARWYLRFKLSLRDLVEMMAERGLPLAHTTIMRWVRHYAPEFERRWNRFARVVGASWRMDETYIKVRGEWVYRNRCEHPTSRRVVYSGTMITFSVRWRNWLAIRVLMPGFSTVLRTLAMSTARSS